MTRLARRSVLQRTAAGMVLVPLVLGAASCTGGRFDDVARVKISTSTPRRAAVMRAESIDSSGTK